MGKPVDTAVGVRTRSAHALARLGHIDSLLVLGEQIADPEASVRRSAVEALVVHGQREAAALAVLKLRIGDEDPLVIAECLSALLALAPDVGLVEARKCLEGGSDELRELAALVLGESRLSDVLELLLELFSEAFSSDQRQPLITALGLQRSKRAHAVLFELIREAGEVDARRAVQAFRVHRENPRVMQALEQAAQLSEHALEDDVRELMEGR